MSEPNVPDHDDDVDVDRRRRAGAVGIAVLLAIVVIGGIVYAVFRAVDGSDQQSDSELVSRQASGYLTDIAAADLPAAADRMCSALDAAATGDGPDLPEVNTPVDDGRVEVVEVRIDGDTATATARLSTGDVDHELTVSLRRESEGWCITQVR